MALVVTATCLALGFPVAYWLARTASRHKNLFLLLVVLPLFVGNAVRAAGWMVLFGSKGFVNSVLGGLGLIGTPLTLMYTEGAVIVGIVAINLPFVVLTLQSVIEGIDRSVEEAALGLGAGPFTTFRRALLPLAMPGVLAGGTLSRIQNSASLADKGELPVSVAEVFRCLSESIWSDLPTDKPASGSRTR